VLTRQGSRHLIKAPNFSLLGIKAHAKKMAEEYCWAITQVAGRSCCGRSGSSVFEFGFQLCVATHTADHMHTQFRVAQNANCTEPSEM
jgi:hypothetical protein